MEEHSNGIRLRQPDEIDNPLTEVLLAGARQLLVQAVALKVEAFLAERAGLTLPDRGGAPGPARPCARA